MTVQTWFDFHSVQSGQDRCAELIIDPSETRGMCRLKALDNGRYLVSLVEHWNNPSNRSPAPREFTLRSEDDIEQVVNWWLDLVALSEEERSALLAKWRRKHGIGL